MKVFKLGLIDYQMEVLIAIVEAYKPANKNEELALNAIKKKLFLAMKDEAKRP